MNTTALKITTLVASLAAALSLAACNKAPDDRTSGQKMDSAVASAEQKAGDMKSDVKEAVNDATITASVNAELAKDPSLSALRINVDTSNGQVLLKGKAPDAAAKDRATQLAQSVKGVNGVDNQLAVGG